MLHLDPQKPFPLCYQWDWFNHWLIDITSNGPRADDKKCYLFRRCPFLCPCSRSMMAVVMLLRSFIRYLVFEIPNTWDLLQRKPHCIPCSHTCSCTFTLHGCAWLWTVGRASVWMYSSSTDGHLAVALFVFIFSLNMMVALSPIRPV